jgi:hypothetical protein
MMHEGWCFQIKGNFFPEKAKAALLDSQAAEDSGQIPATVGLRAAVGQWMSTRSADAHK